MRAVAKPRPESPSARLFIALDLPDEVRGGLAHWQESALGTDNALRPVRPEALHITLAFLGYLPEREIERISKIVADSKAPAPRIQLQPEPIPVPQKRPRLFAIEAESEATVAIQGELSDQLQTAALYEPEKRPFWPHLTVARVRPEGRGARRPARVEHPPGRLPAALEQPFDGVRLSLYRSNLRPEGAEYVFLANIELPPQGGLRGE